MAVLLGDATVDLASLQITGAVFIVYAGRRWFVIAQLELDSGTDYESSVSIHHPTRSYTGRILQWGSIDMSVAVPSGMPQVSGGQIRIADTDERLRDFLAHQTPRRRHLQLKFVQENTSEASAPILYRGEIEDHEKGAGYMQISFKDSTFAWLDEEISSLINRTNYPELDPGIDEAFMPVIMGSCLSSASNPQGVIPLPHIGYTALTGDRWGIAAHTIYSLPAVYRKFPADALYSLVNPSEYTVVEETRVIEGIQFTMSYLKFTLQQTPVPQIAVDCHGLNVRSEWNGYPTVTGTPLRNPIDLFIGLTFYFLSKAGTPAAFDAGAIMKIRERLEALHIYCDGAITKPLTAREFLGQFLPSAGLHLFQTTQGLISLGFIENEDSGRPIFTAKRHMERNSFREFRASPTVNRLRYNYGLNYVTNEWNSKVKYDNSADQSALGKVEEDTFLMYFVRDTATADYVAGKRISYQALGSYRQEWQMPAPEVYSQIDLLKQVGITHPDGMEVGGYTNQEVVVTNLTFDLDTFRVRARSIVRVPRIIRQSVIQLETVFRAGIIAGLPIANNVAFQYNAADWPSGTTFTFVRTGSLGTHPVATLRDVTGAVDVATIPSLPDPYDSTGPLSLTDGHFYSCGIDEQVWLFANSASTAPTILDFGDLVVGRFSYTGLVGLSINRSDYPGITAARFRTRVKTGGIIAPTVLKLMDESANVLFSQTFAVGNTETVVDVPISLTGSHIYRLGFEHGDIGPFASPVCAFNPQIWIFQSNTTRARMQIPMMVAVDDGVLGYFFTDSATYAPLDGPPPGGVFRKTAGIFNPIDHWEVSVVLDPLSFPGAIALWNLTTNLMVAGTEWAFTTGDTTHTMSIADNAISFNNGNDFEFRAHRTGGSPGDTVSIVFAALFPTIQW